jgi:hypothetical protein
MRIGKIGRVNRMTKHRRLFGVRLGEAGWVGALQHAGPNFHLVEVTREESPKLTNCELTGMVRIGSASDIAIRCSDETYAFRTQDSDHFLETSLLISEVLKVLGADNEV